MNKMWISEGSVFISAKGNEPCSWSGGLHASQHCDKERGQALQILVIFQNKKKIAMESSMGLTGDLQRNVHGLANVRL